MKLILKKILDIFGYKLLNMKERKKHSTFGIISHLLNIIIKSGKFSRLRIIDVGGNNGEFSKKVEKILIKERKDYEFFIFEPNHHLIKEIEQKRIQNSKIFNYGVGDKKEEKNFNMHDSHEKSSFLNVDKSYFLNHKKYNISNFSSKIETLDDFSKENKIDHINFLKIDTQGYNAKVLQGAKNLIKNDAIDFIYTEIILGPKYEIRETFYDFEKILKENYDLYGLDVGKYYIEVLSRRSDNHLSLDLFYVNKNINL